MVMGVRTITAAGFAREKEREREGKGRRKEIHVHCKSSISVPTLSMHTTVRQTNHHTVQSERPPKAYQHGKSLLCAVSMRVHRWELGDLLHVDSSLHNHRRANSKEYFGPIFAIRHAHRYWYYMATIRCRSHSVILIL